MTIAEAIDEIYSTEEFESLRKNLSTRLKVLLAVLSLEEYVSLKSRWSSFTVNGAGRNFFSAEEICDEIRELFEEYFADSTVKTHLLKSATLGDNDPSHYRYPEDFCLTREQLVNCDTGAKSYHYASKGGRDELRKVLMMFPLTQKLLEGKKLVSPTQKKSTAKTTAKVKKEVETVKKEQTVEDLCKKVLQLEAELNELKKQLVKLV